MKFDVVIPTWALTLSYWVHLLATVAWLGGLTLMAFVAWPAVRRRVLEQDQWLELQRLLTPLANISLILLWATGFLQMAANDQYEGFLVFRNTWSQAIVIKHIAVIGMMAFGLYAQWRVHPALARLALLETKQPRIAREEREKLVNQEVRLLRLNLVCAAAVLFCTAVATAV